MQLYYVYEWVRPDLNLPYYIGKGTGNRAYEAKRNSHTDKVTKFLTDNGMSREVRILARFKNEKSALEFEIERISFFNNLKDHGILTNQTEGGVGGRPDPEAIQKIKLKLSGVKKSEKTRQLMRLTNSRDTRGSKNGMYGRTHPNKGKAFVNGELIFTNKKERLYKRTLEDREKNSGENHWSYGKPSPMRGKTNAGASQAQKKRWENFRREKMLLLKGGV